MAPFGGIRVEKASARACRADDFSFDYLFAGTGRKFAEFVFELNTAVTEQEPDVWDYAPALAVGAVNGARIGINFDLVGRIGQNVMHGRGLL